MLGLFKMENFEVSSSLFFEYLSHESAFKLPLLDASSVNWYWLFLCIQHINAIDHNMNFMVGTWALRSGQFI